MKKILILSLIVVLFVACSKNDDNSNIEVNNHKIVGNWQLIEIKDEGDLGVWQIIENGTITEFKSNGEVVTNNNNGNVCELRTYQIREVSNADDELEYFCNGQYSTTITFLITEEDQLILKNIWSWSKFNRLAD